MCRSPPDNVSFDATWARQQFSPEEHECYFRLNPGFCQPSLLDSSLRKVMTGAYCIIEQHIKEGNLDEYFFERNALVVSAPSAP